MKKRYFPILLLSMLAGTASAATTVIQPADGKDAQIANEQLADNNWANFDLITNWQGNFRSIGLVEFDLSSIPNLPITNATLSLYHSENYNLDRTYSIFRITSPWDEATVTFNSAPSYDPVAVASLTINDNDKGLYRDWDITSLVSGWLNGSFANYGLWIEEIPVQGEATAYFNGSEQGNGPRLTVASVPLPSAVWLFTSALFGLLGMRKRSA